MRRSFLVLGVMLLALTGCVSLPDKRATAGVAQWSSSADGVRKLARQADVALQALPTSADAVTVDPSQRFQAMVGFGAAMTDASAELLSGMPDPAVREALFDELFRPDQLNLSFMRLPIGASDFSREHYSFNDLPKGQQDPALKYFNMDRANAQIDAVKAARKRNPELLLMASPWSAPGWMKSSDSLITGKLEPIHFASFAAYFDRYLAEMKRQGLPVSYLSIQNEPHFEPKDYPGMRVDPAARAAFIGQHLGPLLARRYPETKILDWDHNWNEPDSPLEVLKEPLARRYVSGVAWHCYGGDVSAQGAVRAQFPDRDVFFTECSGGEWAPKWGETLGWMTTQLIIGSSRNWSRGTLLWNLALDEKFGPHNGGCGNCRGVVTIDSKTGAVTRNVEYYVLGHAARFVRRGARRIASDQRGGLLNVVFANPDGSLVMIAHNPTAVAAQLNVRQGGIGFTQLLPPGEVSTFVWQGVR